MCPKKQIVTKRRPKTKEWNKTKRYLFYIIFLINLNRFIENKKNRKKNILEQS